MIILKGKYNSCKIFNNNIENKAISQVTTYINHIISVGQKIRFMPDIHAGKGCTIGFTATFNEYVIPNIIGVDIGCGITSYKIHEDMIRDNINIDFDNYLRRNIPLGHKVNKEIQIEYIDIFEQIELLSEIREVCKIIKDNKKYPYHLNSIGSLGGGNHFIEVNKSGENVYFTVHSGSRNFGKIICDYFQLRAIEYCKNKFKKDYKNELNKLKEKYKGKDLENKINELKEKRKSEYIPKELSYLSNKDKNDYLYCMKIAQKFAKLNRRIIIYKILEYFDIPYNEDNTIESIHNYIDFNDNIIRKGAIRACKGDIVVIPMNMAYGIIIGIGKGNEDWNNSAPHGAGRKMSRSEAKKKISIESFKDKMKNIYTTSVNQNTIDEAPQAYKDPEHILNYLKETVDILDIAKPIYNLKA